MEPLSDATQRPGNMPRNVVVLGVVSLLTDMSTEIVYPLLPLFLVALGAGPAFVGVVEGVAETTASLLRFVAGWLSDRLRKRKAIALFGYGLSHATRPFMALASAPWHVLGVRFVDRVGKGIRGAPRDALIADSTNESMRGRAFGFHRAMDHAGAVIGPLIAFGLLQTVFRVDGDTIPIRTYRLIFWAATVPAVLAVGALAIFVREVAPAGSVGRDGVRPSLRDFDKRFKAFIAILAVFTLGNSSDAFLLLRARGLGVEAQWIPILWVVLHVVKSWTSTPGSAWSDRVGRRRAILAGWLVYAAVYVGFALASTRWHMWALFSVYGVYFGMTEGSEKALVADLVPSELRSTAYGVHGLAIGLAALPSSVVMGVLWGQFSARVAFLYGGGMAVVASIALIAFLRDEAKR